MTKKISKAYFIFILILFNNTYAFAQNTIDSIINLTNTEQWESEKYKIKTKILINAINKNVHQTPKQTYLLASKLHKLAISKNDCITEIDALKYMGNCNLFQNKITTAILLYKKSQKRATEISYKKGIAAAFHNIAYSYFQIDKYKKALLNYKNALNIDSLSDNKTGMAESYIGVGIIYAKKNALDLAFKELHKANLIGKKLKDSVIIARTFHNLSEVYKIKGNLNTSLKYLDSAKIYLQKQNLPILEIQNKYSLGEIYEKKSNLKKALKNYRLVISNSKEINFLKGEAMALNSIGNISKYQKQYKKALQNYMQSLEIMKKINDNTGIIIASDNIGNIYELQKQFDKALNYYNKALIIKQINNNINAIAVSKSNIGMLHLKLGNTKKALNFITDAYNINKKSKNKTEMANNAKNIGIIYFQKHEYDKAEKHLNECIEIAKEKNILLLQKSSYGLLANIYAQKNDYKKAFECNQVFAMLKDSLFNIETQKQLDDIITQYNADKKEQENKFLKEETRANQLSIERRNSIIIGTTFIALIALVLGLVILNSRKKLKTKNDKILNQAEILSEKNEKLIELDNFKQGVTAMIVHDLKNPLAAMLSIIDNQKNYIIDNRLYNHTNNILNMVSDILDVQKLEKSKMKLNFDFFSINDIIYKVIEDVKFLANEKNITIYYSNEKKFQIKADKDIVERILQNLLTNAIKYTPVNEKIIISIITINDKQIEISVKDNGQGIPLKFQKTIFDKFGQVEARKLGKARSTGLGLTFCKLAVEAHGEKINVISEEGKGATFGFSMPYILTKNKTETTNKKEILNTKIILNLEEKKILYPYLEQLKVLKIYEISKIKKILNQIESIENENIKNWCRELNNSLCTSNKELFNVLINI